MRNSFLLFLPTATSAATTSREISPNSPSGTDQTTTVLTPAGTNNPAAFPRMTADTSVDFTIAG